jgi:hypothetical protein
VIVWTQRRRDLAKRHKGTGDARFCDVSSRFKGTDQPQPRLHPLGAERRCASLRRDLAADFRCSNPDGSLVDRGGFLAQTARPVTISNLAAHDVEIRMFGDVAIIHARTSYTMADGRPGAGRYTDVWARQNGEWRAVSAHVTRC